MNINCEQSWERKTVYLIGAMAGVEGQGDQCEAEINKLPRHDLKQSMATGYGLGIGIASVLSEDVVLNWEEIPADMHRVVEDGVRLGLELGGNGLDINTAKEAFIRMADHFLDKRGY